MAIVAEAAEYIHNIIVENGIGGGCLCFGKQDTFISENQLYRIMVDAGLAEFAHNTLTIKDQARGQRMQRLKQAGRHLQAKQPADRKVYISDAYLFAAFGFEELHSLDNSTYEGADIVFDMNRDDIASVLDRQYDFVFDGGTSEHVFHVPNFLKNVFHALKVGGHIVHAAPSNNHVDHGFYQFSPTLFHDWYTANRFDIRKIEFFRYSVNHDREPWMYMKYRPGCLNNLSFGGLDDRLYGTYVCARKTDRSTCDRIPQQSLYQQAWSAGGGAP